MRAALIGVGGLVLATGVAVGVYAASTGGGEEEVLQDLKTPTASTNASPTSELATGTPVVTDATEPNAGFDTYLDTATGLSVPYPEGDSKEERSIDLPGREDIPAVAARQIIFRNADQLPTVSISISPNPQGVDLERWVRSIIGWPVEPERVTVDGEPALLFSEDPAGENQTVYFVIGSSVAAVRGNVAGAQGSPATISEEDFWSIVDAVEIP